MGGCRCSYKNCTNTTKTRENLHFFHYPVKQKERCKQWIENANKPQFYDLDEDQLRNKVVCETHFEDCYFPNIQKKRLLQGAIPTLDGDCEVKIPERVMKIQDVQILPANADGTIFVLETNMQQNFQSEKVESYIYTNNGLVLPVNKCNDNMDDSMQTMYSGSEIEEVDDPHIKEEIFTINNANDNYTDRDSNNFMFASSGVMRESPQINFPGKSKTRKLSQQSQKTHQDNKITEDMITKHQLNNKYVKKIKQHSKDIAFLKRVLKSKTSCRKPTIPIILNSLKRQLPSSLLAVVRFNLNEKCDLPTEDLDFFSTIYSTSPQVYELLSQKFNWKLPDPETFENENGHTP